MDFSAAQPLWDLWKTTRTIHSFGNPLSHMAWKSGSKSSTAAIFSRVQTKLLHTVWSNFLLQWIVFQKKAGLTSHVSVSWITPSEQKRVFQTTFYDKQINGGIQEAVAQTCLGRLGYLACIPNLCTNNCSLINFTIWVGTNCIYIPLKLPLIPNTSDFGVSNDFRRGTVAHEHACNKA